MREMKDSGIEWIGKIPKEWKLCRFKNIAELYTGNSIKDQEKHQYEDSIEARPYIATKDINITFSSANYKNGLYVKLDDCSFKIAPVNSTLMCIEGGSAGRKKVKLSKEVSFVNKLCCFFSKKVDNTYLYYFLCSPNYEKVFTNNLTGLIGGVSVSVLKNIPFILPIPAQQHRITAYLDNKCGKIDAIIAHEQTVIEKLKAYKQSIITEAVTKGLNPHVKMKDSGIEWIGEIPEKWEVVKAKHVFQRIGDVDHYMPKSIESGIPYLMTGDLKEATSKIDFRGCKKISLNNYKKLSNKIKADVGDVIFARYATIGTLCYVDTQEEFIVSYSCVTIKPKMKILKGKFLFYYLKSSSFIEDVKQYINSNTQGNIGIDSLNKVKIVLPSMFVQQQIADYLDQKCAKIESSITKKQSVIDKLTEYKKSLIYEVVTGKKEV